MRTVRNLLPMLLFLAFAGWAPAQLDLQAARPPVAKTAPRTVTLHGDTRIDNYHWLRDKADPAVKAYLEAENAYTAAVMKRTEALQETLYSEMLGRIKQTDETVPYRQGEHWYYSRTEQGKQYPIYCRKRGSLDASEEVTLDLNALGKGLPFISRGAYVVSDDGNLLAYSLDVTGFREYTLHVKDLRTGEVLPDRVEKVRTVAWAADNKTLLYVTEDEAKRPYRLYRHTLGGNGDELIYEEKDGVYELDVVRSRDKTHAFAVSASATTTEVRFAPSDKPNASWRLIHPRENEHEYYVEHRGGVFYIRTNKGGKNFRLVTAPIADPGPEKWKELVPHRPDVMLDDVDVFAGHCVLTEQEDGLPNLRVLDLESGQAHRIAMPEPIYAVFGENNPEFHTSVFRFRYESLVTPESTYDYDLKTRERTLRKQIEVRGYDPERYTSERLFATASDGTRIPVSVVYKKGLKKGGTSPLLLEGYGAYGYPLPIMFDSQRVSLLDRGVIFAQAHIRGGGEMGKAWHDQGRMLAKRNTFTDFIAAAEHLIREKYTSKDRLVIQGGSAGGLTIGAAVNMRPDLCKAAVLHVPFVDVMNTMLDPSLPLTTQEYLEWGNPNVKEEYAYMRTYCPYSNIEAKDYPAILVETSWNDSQVMYWEPAKYVAKLRATKSDKNVLLLKTKMESGHGGASGRYDALRERAFTDAFILNQLGITK